MWVGLVLAGTSTCTPPPARIHRLTVNPAEVCPNDAVETSWTVDGDHVRLRQEPPMSLEESGVAVSSQGMQAVSGDRDFDVIIEATGKGKNKEVSSQRRYVHVITEGWTLVLTGPHECRDGQVHASLNVELGDPLLDARMQVLTVMPRVDRSITVWHGGLPSVTFPPGSLTAFQGTLVRGLWQLSMPLKEGESCTPADAGGGKPPPSPAIILATTCGGLPRVAQPTGRAGDAPRCGQFNQPCCQGQSCSGQYRCSLPAGICVGGLHPLSVKTPGVRCTREPATSSSRSYHVGLRDLKGCGQVLTQLADSQDEANRCSLAHTNFTTTLASGTLTRYAFCKNRRAVVYASAFNDEDAETCIRSRWPRVSLKAGACQ
jgi:hypothetical protein